MKSGITSDSNLIAEIERYSWGILLLLLALSLLFLSPRVTVGVLTGGLICILNFRWLKFFIQRVLFCGDANRAKTMARVNYILRYLAVGVIIYGVFKAGLVNIPATFVGLSVVFLAISAVGIRRAFTEAARRRI